MFAGEERSFANDALPGSRPFANGTPAEHPQRRQLHIGAVVFLKRDRADLQPIHVFSE
jgi:hypothetical protein